MKRTRIALALMVSAIFSSGCASFKGATDQLVNYKAVYGRGPGLVETISTQGVSKLNSLPWDYTYSFEHGVYSTSTSAFKIEGLVGADCYQGENGLEGSPWAGIRFVHVENVGADVGFDKANVTAGLDWLVRDLAIGPNVLFPYRLGPSTLGLKAGFLFN